MAEFRMPALGADMAEGVLLEWLVRPGTTVHKGDIIAVVDTDKAAIEVECFDDGTIDRLLVEPGTRVPVGTPLATILGSTPAEAKIAGPAETKIAGGRSVVGAVSASAGSPVTSPLVRRQAAARHVDLGSIHGTGPGGRITRADVEHAGERPAHVRASPQARRLAAAAGVDLAALTGSGPDGAVTAEDVRAATVRTAPQPARAEPAPQPARAEPATKQPPVESPERAEAMRHTIAALMSRSKREIPHYYLTETIDLTDTLRWLRERNRALPVPQRIVPAALLLKASALAARAVPQLNGFWQDDHFIPAPTVHLGVAVSLRGGGLVAPAIHDAAALGLPDLMARLKDLVARVRAGRLRGSELTSPTITVSNLGEQGVESIIGVIYPPQVALVGFGAIAERPWAVNGLLGVRQVVTASLAGDHRATDGATGARYLREIARLLHQPEEL